MTPEERQAELDSALTRYPNVPRSVAERLIGVESGGNPGARSYKGAFGMTQLMPDTAREMGVTDPSDWRQQIEGGMKYLSQNIARFSREPGSIPNTSDGLMTTPDYVKRIAFDQPPEVQLGVAAYHAGPGAVARGNGAAPAAAGLAPVDRSLLPGATRVNNPLYGFGDVKLSPAQTGLWSDAKNSLMGGFDMAAQDMREVTRRALGERVVGTIDRLGDALGMKSPDQLAEEHQAALSPEMQAALGKKWWDDETNSFGPAWTDWRSYAGGLLQSLPEQALTMVPSFRLASVVQGRIFGAAMKAGIEKGMTEEAAQLAASKVAAAAAERTAYLAGGGSEGLLAGAQSSRQVREQVLKLPDDTLDQSQLFQRLVVENNGDRAKARAQLADDRATQAFAFAGITTGMFGGVGDKILARAVFKGLEGGFAKRLAKGALGEGLLEEFPQSYLQQVSENLAMQGADPHVKTFADALNQGLGGLAVGALQGGGQTAIFGKQAHPENAPAAGQNAPPAAPAASGLPTQAPTAENTPSGAIPVSPQPPSDEAMAQLHKSARADIADLRDFTPAYPGPNTTTTGATVTNAPEKVPEAEVQRRLAAVADMQEGDIGRPRDGAPFKARIAAAGFMHRNGPLMSKSHEVVALGPDAFVIRPKAASAEQGAENAAPVEPAPVGAPAAPPAEVAPLAAESVPATAPREPAPATPSAVAPTVAPAPAPQAVAPAAPAAVAPAETKPSGPPPSEPVAPGASITGSGTYTDGGKWTRRYDAIRRSDGTFALMRTRTDEDGERVEHLNNDSEWVNGRPARTAMSVTGENATGRAAVESYPTEQAALDAARSDLADDKGSETVAETKKPVTPQVEAIAGTAPLGVKESSSGKPVSDTNKQPAVAEHAPIGKNADGQTIYEDKRAVRSIVEDGVRITEPVAMVPKRGGGMQVSVNWETRDARFKTAHERQVAETAPESSGKTVPQLSETQSVAEVTQSNTPELISQPAPPVAEPPAQFANNTIFTADKVEAARARLKKKLGTLGTGIDPEVMIDGMTIAGAYIESGVRDFATFTTRMVADFGEAIRPYLRSFYESARHHPGLDTSGMTATNDIDKAASEPKIQSEGSALNEPEPSGIREVGPPGIREPDETGGNAQPPTAPADAALVGTDAAGDVRTPEGARNPRRNGRRPAKQDVGGAGDLFGSGDGSDGRQGASGTGVVDAGTGERPGQPASDQPAPAKQPGLGNYHITDPAALVGGGPKARFAKNRAAIQALNAVSDESRDATPAERDALAAYTGWGSFGQELFKGSWDRDNPMDGWEKESAWLREHLGKEAWESAQRSILNAHYTDPPTVQTMWRMVERMGFTGGRVLEPSIGIGNFFGLMPRALMETSQLAGIELDRTTGRMAQILYPDANIQIKGYETSKTADGFYDLVIGNWPFAKDGPSDRRYNAFNPSLHDYFFLKAIDQVRPGGLVVGVTSNGTMDKRGTIARREMAKKAELVAAFRLPTGAFQEYAGTKVVTDILVFRKRSGALPDVAEQGWINSHDVEVDPGDNYRPQTIHVNEYWGTHPENILGVMTWGRGTTTGQPGMIVNRQADFPGKLAALPERLPTGIFTPGARQQINYVTNNTKDRERSVTLGDKDALMVVRGEYLAPLHEIANYKVKSESETAERESQVKALIAMRRAYGALIDAERDGKPGVDALRKTLHDQYKAFTKAYGPLNRSYGLSLLDKISDPFYPMLAALEVDKGTGKAKSYTPARILFEQTTRGKVAMEHPSITDAFVLARNASLEVDPAAIAKLAGSTEQAVITKLTTAGAIFQTPGGNYEVSDVYLSGNVRRKLREAEEAQAAGHDMARNIEALKKVMPPDTPYFKIEAKLGAPWVAAKQYEAFVHELLGLTSDEDKNAVKIENRLSSWRVEIDDPDILRKPEARTIHGVDFYPFDKLLKAAMNNVAITIRTADEKGVPQFNPALTEEVNQKAAALRERFPEWLWADMDRRLASEVDYNEAMNAIADVKFDGSFLSFAGMALQRGADQFSLRAHQVNAIWRGLVNRMGIYAHEVGTGKTYTMGGLAMESRRYGIAKKPLLFAHNANSASVAREIGEMYPGAKVLYVDNLDPGRIDITMRQIANDDWDAVVVPHSLIDRFGLREETLNALAAEEIAALEEEAIEAAQADGAQLSVADMGDEKAMKKVRSSTAKELVKARNAILTKIQDMALRASKENAVPFEELGVDMVMVDEAHEFKKPPLVTRMTLKGLNKGTSNKSIALRFLTDYVKGLNNGTGVHLFTGTPITNTLNEIYNLQRFVADSQMARDGVKDWDGWFNTFADSVTDVELTAAATFEPVTRLASFVNTAELRRMIGGYTDIVFADDMPEFKPRATASGKTMNSESLTAQEKAQLLDGRTEKPIGRPYKKIINDVAPMTGDQQAILAALVERANHFKGASKKERRNIMLSGHPSSPVIVETDAAAAGLDPRLYDMAAGDDPQLKVNRATKNILTHYAEHPKATQAVFVERGYNSTAERAVRDEGGEVVRGPDGKPLRQRVPTFNLVDDLITKLVKGGIPREQIAVVSGATSKEKRKETADKMNTAEVRVVIGLSTTLGTGVNMQDNLRAMHHLDAPWMPGLLEQRNGRGWRQGNQWNTVLEYRYITDRVDGRRWQVLAVKERFIKAFLTADQNVRVIEGDAASMDEDDDILGSLSEAAGDPRILLKEKYKKDVERLQNKQRYHDYARDDARQRIKTAREEIRTYERRVQEREAARTTFTNELAKPFSAVVLDKTYTERKDFDEALKAWVGTLQVGVAWERIGTVRGFTMYGRWPHKNAELQVELRGPGGYAMHVGASIASIDGTLRALSGHIADGLAKIESLNDSIPRLEEASKAEFPRADDLAKKKHLLEQLEADLASNPVPAPIWLRQGAPIKTTIFVDGREYEVEGHQWAKDGFYVIVNSDDGLRRVPYGEAKDASGMAVYDPHPFAPPVAGAAVIAPGVLLTDTRNGKRYKAQTAPYEQDGVSLVRVRAEEGGAIEEIRASDLAMDKRPEPTLIPLLKGTTPPALSVNEPLPPGQWGSNLATHAQDEKAVATLETAIRNMLDKVGIAPGELPAGAYRPVVLPDAADIGVVASAFGKRVVGFDVDRDKASPRLARISGVARVVGDTIFIGAHADRPHFVVLGHELVHEMRLDSPSLYDQFERAIRPIINEKAYQTFGEKWRTLGVSADHKIREEFLAEVVADGFHNPKFWNALGQRNPTLLARVFDAARALFQKAIRALSGRGFKTEPYLSDFNRAMEIAGAAMARYGREADARKAAEPITTDEGPLLDVSDLTADTKRRIVNAIQDRMASDKGFNWWHRTVGTQYHKAQVVPEFKPVFEGTQDYITDVSQFSMDAADQAPDLLPRLEKIGPVLKDLADLATGGRKTRAHDVNQRAAGTALFIGTLQNKGFTDAELKAGDPASGRAALTEQQIKLYHEAYAAINRSLADLVASEAWRLTRGINITPLVIARRLAKQDSANARAIYQQAFADAIPVLEQHAANAKNDEGRADAAVDEFKALAKTVDNAFNRVQKLKSEAYAPLMRFGAYSLKVLPKQGQMEFYTFESVAERNAYAREVAADKAYAGATITKGVMPQKAFKLFEGLSPEALDLFIKATGLEKDPLVQEFLRNVTATRSGLKRLIHRQGIKGFSFDTSRVLASFVTSNARLASRNYHYGDLVQSAEAIPKEMGVVKDEATDLIDYVQHPKEEAHAVRGLLFVQFLGGSVASALVNATQPVMMTAPYLSQFTNPVDAFKRLFGAARIATGGAIADPELKNAVELATREGIVAPHEIHQLYAEAIRGLGGNIHWRRALRVWGSLFALAESFNRKITFVAAYRIAKEMTPDKLRDAGVRNAYAFAVKAVEDTQGIYNKGNRPNWARGSIGSTVFTFKQFTISYLEFLKRLPMREKLLAGALLVLAAGLQGLPGADDAEDIIDTVGQALGYGTNSKKWIRELLTSTLGEYAGNFILHGTSGIPGMPFDVQARFSLGNLIPGSAALKRSETDKTGDLLELVGPVGSVAQSIGRAATAAEAHNAAGVAQSLAPTAIGNAMKAVDMLQSGQYRDTKGRKVIDTDVMDALWKGVGFQPQNVAMESRATRGVQQDVTLVKSVESDIADLWAKGVRDHDPDAVASARDKLRQWNDDNPELRIAITGAQIQRRVQEMRKERAQRVIQSAPREVRQNVRGSLQ